MWAQDRTASGGGAGSKEGLDHLYQNHLDTPGLHPTHWLIILGVGPGKFSFLSSPLEARGSWTTLASKVHILRKARELPLIGGWFHYSLICLTLIPLRAFALGASRPTYPKLPPPHRLTLSSSTSSEGSPEA